jgi:FkbM family methyltransferase
MVNVDCGSSLLRGASLRSRCAKLLQRALLRGGVWITPLNRFKREVIRIAYRTGGFSFIQIGANDGVSFDDFFWLVTHFNGCGLAIEPMTEAFERLTHNYRPYPGVKPVRLALHPTLSGVTLFRVAATKMDSVPPWAYGSASMDPTWLPRQGVKDEVLEQENCPAASLMSIVDDYQINDLNVLQIDVEGFDLEVIKMIDFDKLHPDIIRFELPQGHNQEDSKVATAVIEKLRKNKYRVVVEGMDAIAIKQ